MKQILKWQQAKHADVCILSFCEETLDNSGHLSFPSLCVMNTLVHVCILVKCVDRYTQHPVEELRKRSYTELVIIKCTALDIRGLMDPVDSFC